MLEAYAFQIVLGLVLTLKITCCVPSKKGYLREFAEKD